jgi:glycine cleavage system aminomethyltransferase T
MNTKERPMHPFTTSSETEHKSPLEDVVRRHGARIIKRDDRRVAVHYGSPTSEAAVCLTTVGIADRFDRTTLELRGAYRDVELALIGLARLRIRTWWSRLTDRTAIVRCEHADAAQCLEALMPTHETVAVDVSDWYAAIGLIGPRAAEMLRTRDFETLGTFPIVLREAQTAFEVLVPAAEGPAQWEELLVVGVPFQLACVGLDALARLAASHRLDSAVIAATLD